MSKLSETYQDITDMIIAELENGVLPWRKPWTGGNGLASFPKRHNGEFYSGINILILWCYAEKKGFQSPFWMTFNQAKKQGAKIRKGEKGAPVFYSSVLTVNREGENGQLQEDNIPYRKKYCVFNAEQIDGLDECFFPKIEPVTRDETLQKIEAAERFITSTGAHIEHVGQQPKFIPALDKIEMPDFETFKSANGYYTTLFHELTHWTGAKKRLNRDFSYALEELIAELGSCFLAVENNVMLDIKQDHAPYIAGWLKSLKNDKTFIFKAAAQAQKSTNYLKEENQ